MPPARANPTLVPRAAAQALTLSAEIRQRFDEFSRSQKDVGQYIVDHRDEVAAAIERISRSDRILLCGTDQMAFFASYLRHLLMLLDLRCEVVASPSQEGLARLGRIDERTLVVGFSAGRPHPLVVRAMKLAPHRRASTIATADAPPS